MSNQGEDNSILRSFQTDKTPRNGQTVVLTEYEKAVQEGYKSIIIEAPTGLGKSPIAYTLLNYHGSGYIATATKALQLQYKEEYPEFFEIKGKGTFDCNFMAERNIAGKQHVCGFCEEKTRNVTFSDCKHKSASDAPCVTDNNFKDAEGKNCCPYYINGDDYASKYVQDTINNRGLIQVIELLPETLERIKRVRMDGEFNLRENKGYTDRQKKMIMNAVRPCLYYDQLTKGLMAKFSVLNYSNYILFSHMQKLNNRKVTIFDEAHKIEDQIIDFCQLSFDIRHIRRVLDSVNYFDRLDKDDEENNDDDDEDLTPIEIPDSYDVMDHVPLMEKLHSVFEEIAKMPAGTDKAKRIKKNAKEVRDKIKRTLDFIALDVNNWKVIDLIRNKQGEIEKSLYKPINLSYFCQLIYKNSDINVFMSATILDRDMFCKNHGLDPELTKFIQIDSDFPIENRPIYLVNIAELNRDTINTPAVQRKIINKIDEIADRYPEQKGIIHTTSYSQLNFVRDGISVHTGKRLRITDPERIETIKVVEEHRNGKEPTILISPALHTGIDLKDDDSRFQVVLKMPYPFLGDKWIELKRQADPNWYTYKTALTLVQAYGRSIRSKTDYADTYILDSNFQFKFLNNPRAQRLLPKWFKDAIIRRDKV